MSATVTMRWRSKHSDALLDKDTHELDVEGAIRAGKTTLCLWREFNATQEYPGIPILLSRWTDRGVYGLLRPLWLHICDQAGVRITWHPAEEYDLLPNGSKVFFRGLKSQDATLRYCCAPETRVLCADLRWRPAGDLRAGDELVGVDELNGRAKKDRRRILPSHVVGTTAFNDDRFRVATDRGDLIANAAHPLLTTSRSRPGRAKTGAVWTEVRDLRVGDVVKFLAAPWEDRSDSWFAGILDGEGHVALCQTLMFCRLGDVMRVLGSYRPIRFFEKGRAALLNGDVCLPHKDDKAVIHAIEPIGPGPVVGIETTTRTLITNGLVSHNSKFRGLTLARVYVDQAEEVPQDVYLELAGRLSAPDFPHQITISPQSVSEDHWIAKEFPADNSKPSRRYIPLSVYDNAHNLAPQVIPNLERIYPPEHPQHRTLILGRRGMNVIGDPVYKGAFRRALHEGKAEFDKTLPLEMALDFGKHHPCAIFRQVSPFGQVRYLGGVLGQNLYLETFLDTVLTLRSQWCPQAIEYRECCDPAGASDTSHGTRGALSILAEKGIHARYVPDSNSPAVRLACIERMAAQMRKRAADGSESFMVSDSERWVRVSAQASVVDRFLADGFEAGYVWDEHMVSVNNKPMRKPKKDGWYEHGQNCAEYLEANFGSQPPPKPEEQAPATDHRSLSPWG